MDIEVPKWTFEIPKRTFKVKKYMFEAQKLTFEGCFEIKTTLKNILDPNIPGSFRLDFQSNLYFFREN